MKCELCSKEVNKLYIAMFTDDGEVNYPMKVCESCVPEEQIETVEQVFFPGDIFLCDSNRSIAKFVKFLMTAPTIYQYIWRAIRHKNQEVRYYHAGMVIDENTIIEQEGKVHFSPLDKITSRTIIFYRKKSLTEMQEMKLSGVALNDMDKKYGVVSILGKTLTWLTGIKLFSRFVHWDDTEICINRVCKWYYQAANELFGVKNYRYSTTHTVDKYCAARPNEWEIVYQNEEN